MEKTCEYALVIRQVESVISPPPKKILWWFICLYHLHFIFFEDIASNVVDDGIFMNNNKYIDKTQLMINLLFAYVVFTYNTWLLEYPIICGIMFSMWPSVS